MDLKEKIKNLPHTPGVYLMKDSLNTVIYVGKSKNLKNRVGSYFQNSKSHSSKVINLVQNLKDFEIIHTDTEFEAFMLECKLIKEFKPRYNKKMKTPMAYSYIKIDMNENYPYIEMTHDENKTDNILYWGPYTSKNTVERAVQGIKECCKILCNNNQAKPSACLNYSLELCIGMCLEEVSRDYYVSIIKKIVDQLNGCDNSLLLDMENTMNIAALKFDFETAARYRDYISAIKCLIDKSEIIKFAEATHNLVILEYLDDSALKYFIVKGHRVLYSEKYVINDRTPNDLNQIIEEKILFYFKKNKKSASINIGKNEIDESQIVYSYIKNKASPCKHVIIPQQWIDNKNFPKLDETINTILEDNK